MGFKTWKAAPDGKIIKSDVTVAKNYLVHQHLAELNRVVSAYLNLAENNAQRGVAFNMQQWAKFLDSFLELSNFKGQRQNFYASSKIKSPKRIRKVQGNSRSNL